MDARPSFREMVTAVGAAIDRHAEELTKLDQAIGDGDHGANMQRGFRSVVKKAEGLAELEFGAALRDAGMTLILNIGGASGPLYGSALIAMGQASAGRPCSRNDVTSMMAAGIEAVRTRGKSDIGAKTMLDLLIPVQVAIARGADLADVRAVADQACEATRAMRATKGRASFLGERSVGHIDPGARSSAVIVHAICDVLEQT